MEIALAVLGTWLLVNVVVLLAWSAHRGALRPGRALPAVTVPVPRAASDAPLTAGTTTAARAVV